MECNVLSKTCAFAAEKPSNRIPINICFEHFITKIEAIKKGCENETAIYTHVYVAKPPQQQTSICSFYSKQKGEPKFSFSKHLKIFYRKMLFPGK
jgi:hypothetical protein